MTGPDLRPAVMGDAPRIAALHALSFGDAWNAGSVGALVETPQSSAWVAEEDGRIVGFLLARKAADEAEILSIAVAKEMRRTGLGRRMLAHLLSDCSGSGIAAIFIEVAEADAGAVAFYDATGFRVCGRRRAYYRDRPPGANDALLMRLDIAAADAP